LFSDLQNNFIIFLEKLNPSEYRGEICFKKSKKKAFENSYQEYNEFYSEDSDVTFAELFIETDSINRAGAQGGDCWGNEATEFVNYDEEIPFPEVLAKLAEIMPSQKLKEIIENILLSIRFVDQYTISEYYGNYYDKEKHRYLLQHLLESIQEVFQQQEFKEDLIKLSLNHPFFIEFLK
jgi:hypothetical protein